MFFFFFQPSGNKMQADAHRCNEMTVGRINMQLVLCVLF